MSADRTSSNEFEAEGEPLEPRKARERKVKGTAGGDGREGGRWKRRGVRDGGLPVEAPRPSITGRQRRAPRNVAARNGFPGNPGGTYAAGL